MAENIVRHITHIKSSSLNTTNDGPKLPTTSQIEFGEIAVNYADGYETLSIKNNASTPEIVTFSSDDKFYKKTETSGSSEISSALSGKSDTGHTHPQYLTGITSGDVTGALGYTPLQTAITSVTTSSTNGNISVNGNNVAVHGLGGAAYLNTGTTASTVAAGDHTHSDYVVTATTVNTASGLTGGGALSGNLTLGLAMPTTHTANTYSSSNTFTSSEPIVYCVCKFTSTLNSQVCPVSNLANGQQCVVIYHNTGATDSVTVSFSTDYLGPDGGTSNTTHSETKLTVKKYGYGEVNFINLGGTIYLRGV